MECALRKAIIEDVSRINELFVEMLQAIYGKYDGEGYKDGNIDRYFFGNESWICAAEINSEIAAFLSIEVHRDKGNYLYLDDFSASKLYRGLGIGTALIAEAEKHARSIDISTIILHVERNNASARRVYEQKRLCCTP